ncbi:MAG: DUF1499 domain-containing protein [Balneolaceae bacterium]
MKKSISKLLFTLSALAVLFFVMSGYGYQWGIWGLGTAFTVLRYSAYTAIGLLLAMTIMLFVAKGEGGKVMTRLVLGILLTGAVSATAWYWQNKAQSVPPIHDITTDLQQPPEFVAMVRLRADAPNPPEYAGEETAERQREAYPNLAPLLLEADLQDVMDAAIFLVADRGWQLAAINRSDGRIEATEKLAWFGFKDDVVLRFTETEAGETRVDMRSKSRIGRSDIGVNADRIRSFLADLEKEFRT